LAAVPATGLAALVGDAVAWDPTDDLRLLAIKALELGAMPRIVARELGIKQTTLYHWSADPEVAEAVARGAVVRRNMHQENLEGSIEDSIDALRTAVNDTTADWADRIRAANSILDRSGLKMTAPAAGQQQEVAVKVDVDWDKRLASITAGTRGSE